MLGRSCIRNSRKDGAEFTGSLKKTGSSKWIIQFKSRKSERLTQKRKGTNKGLNKTIYYDFIIRIISDHMTIFMLVNFQTQTKTPDAYRTVCFLTEKKL